MKTDIWCDAEFITFDYDKDEKKWYFTLGKDVILFVEYKHIVDIILCLVKEFPKYIKDFAEREIESRETKRKGSWNRRTIKTIIGETAYKHFVEVYKREPTIEDYQR